MPREQTGSSVLALTTGAGGYSHKQSEKRAVRIQKLPKSRSSLTSNLV